MARQQKTVTGTLDDLQRDDLVVDREGQTWAVIQVHTPHGRRGKAVTVVRQSDGRAILAETAQLETAGFALCIHEGA